MSEYYAKECIRVVTANGIKVLIADKLTATPVVSYGVKQYGVAGAIVVTASHNPAEYNGIKYKAYYGGSALPNIMTEIEKFLYKNPVQTVTIEEAENSGLIELCNFDKPYAEHIRSLVDLQVISGSGIKVVIDPMYGAGSGYLKDILKDLEVDVVEIRGERNPSFCSINPEPIDKNLFALMDKLYTNPPEMFNDILIKEIQRLDGVKFILEDNSWILFRASGTEPVVRVYAEADSKDKVTELLKTGREIIELK